MNSPGPFKDKWIELKLNKEGKLFFGSPNISILQVFQSCVPCIKYMLYYLRDSTYKIHILFPLEMVDLCNLLFMLTAIY